MQGPHPIDLPKHAEQVALSPPNYHLAVLYHRSAVLIHPPWAGWQYETPAEEESRSIA